MPEIRQKACMPSTRPTCGLSARPIFPRKRSTCSSFPSAASGDSELVRDLLQSGHMRLKIGGSMFVATDNRSDSWLHDELRKLFAKVTRRPLKARDIVQRDQDRVAAETEKLRMPVPFSR